MGRRKVSQQDKKNKTLLIKMTEYVAKTAGVSYTEQADRLEKEMVTFNYRRITDIRNQEGYYPRPQEMALYRRLFEKELEGFDDPSPEKQERDRLLGELEEMREKLDEKEALNEEWQRLYIEAQKKIKKLEEGK